MLLLHLVLAGSAGRQPGMQAAASVPSVDLAISLSLWELYRVIEKQKAVEARAAQKPLRGAGWEPLSSQAELRVTSVRHTPRTRLGQRPFSRFHNGSLMKSRTPTVPTVTQARKGGGRVSPTDTVAHAPQ